MPEYFVKDPDPPWSATCTLAEHIAKLISDGKHANDEEFQRLFRVYGKDKITQMALKAKEEGDTNGSAGNR